MAKRWYSVSVLSNFEKKVAEAIRQAVAEKGAPTREALLAQFRSHRALFAREVAPMPVPWPTEARQLLVRLQENAAELKHIYAETALAVERKRPIAPAAEWLIDNYHIVEKQIRKIRDDLPADYYVQLPKLADGPLAGLPRVFGVAWAYIAHSDSLFHEERLRRFVAAYQRVEALTIGELWALAICLQLVLVENLHRLADLSIHDQGDRQAADALADRLLSADSDADALALLTAMPADASAAFISQLAFRLRDVDSRSEMARRWLESRVTARGDSLAALDQQAQQALIASTASTRNVIMAMRDLAEVDWGEMVEALSPADAILRAGSNFGEMDFPSRNLYRNSLEELSRGSAYAEDVIAARALALANRQPSENRADQDPGFLIVGAGRPLLETDIGFVPPVETRIARRLRQGGIPLYVGLVMLLGDEVVPGTLMGIEAGRVSRGHRFMHAGEVVIDSPSTYVETMRDAKVLVDPDLRRTRIVEQAEAAAREVDGRVRIDADLLEEVNGLNEWPVAVRCAFDREFLEVPQEALISTMEANQKFFPVLDANDRLSEHFVGTANIESKDFAEVRKGYERVIRPRFADAKFFFDEDLKQGLTSMGDGLKTVTYQAKLGSVADKVQRVAALAETIAAQVGVNPALAKRAAELAKNDLQSRMVNEFPELQGIAGRYYAKAAGENDEVALAIDEAYQPRFAGDDIALSGVGKVLAIAERLDTLVGGFAAGLKPTGNKDPFALRRNALGLARTIIESGYDVDLKALIYHAYEAAKIAMSDVVLRQKHDAAEAARAKGVAVPSGQTNARSLDIAELAELYDFILDRLRGYYTDKGVPAALVMASTHALLRSAAQNSAHPGEVLQRVNELLVTQIPASMFVTCLALSIDLTTGAATFANAGHNLPYVRRRSGEVEQLSARGMPLGLMPGSQYDETRTTIGLGELLLLYSDGITEQHDAHGEMFDYSRTEAVVRNATGSADLVRRVTAVLAEFQGDVEQEDDITLVALHRGAAGASSDTVRFAVPSELGNEREAMDRVAAIVGDALAAERLDALKTAVSEMAMNAIEHGNRADPRLDCEVTVRRTAETVVVEIADFGRGRHEMPDVPDLDLKLAGLQSPRGWGLFLARSLVDDIEEFSDGDRHLVRLTMRVRAAEGVNR